MDNVLKANLSPLESDATDGIAWVFFAADAKPTSMRRAIAERLSETDPVVIVDRPVSVLNEGRIPPLRERLEPLESPAHCWRYRPLHFPVRIPVAGHALMSWNRRRLASELSRILAPGARRIVCYDSPAQYHLARRLGEHRSLYLAVDDRTLTVWGEPLKGELAAERRLLQKVDGVICVSGRLAQVLQERVQESGAQPAVEILSNGYDERLFNPDRTWAEPEMLRRVPRPRILVAGHVSERIDWNGVASVLPLRPEWTWFFIGPADEGMHEKAAAINAQTGSGSGSPGRPRVVWHESTSVDEVPALIAHCDACAVPYRLNPFTLASSPLKAIEYLAMGAGVLSTRVPSLQCHAGVIDWVEEGDGMSYALALDHLISRKNSKREAAGRRASVSNESWAQKTGLFRKMVLDFGSTASN